MAQIYEPGVGVDRFTGKVISGWPHVVQSLGVIFTTNFGERWWRENFGSHVPKILGERMVPSTVLKFWTAIFVAIEAFEPRYRPTQISPHASPEAMRLGAMGFRLDGIYRPRGHLGDFTPAGARSVSFLRRADGNFAQDE